MSNIKELECPIYNDELDNVGNEREKVTLSYWVDDTYLREV